MNIARYEHHGGLVWVMSDLRGKHRDYCLCHRCTAFKPGQPDNCPQAQELYEFCVKHNATTPMWECAIFQPVVAKLPQV